MINQALKSYISASILTLAVVQLNSVIDSILMGHFINPDALAAITLSGPVITLIVSLYILLAGGAALLAGKKIGERNYEYASRIFSVSMHTLIIVALVVSGFCAYFCNDIVALYCDDSRLLPYVTDYMSVCFYCLIFSMLTQSMSQFTNVDGKPHVVTRAMVFCVLTNILFDVILVAVMGVGVGGSAIASALGYIVSIVLLFPHTFGTRGSYKYRVIVPHGLSILIDNLKHGWVMQIIVVFSAVATYFTNSIILSTLGANGMFVVSITGALIIIGSLFASGTSQAFVAIGGMLFGQRDYWGMRVLFVRCFLVVTAAAVAITILGLVKPDFFAILFGAKSDLLIAESREGVRIIVMMLIPLFIVNMMPAVYQVLGHLIVVDIISFLFNVFLVSSMWLLSRSETPSDIWYAYPIAGWSSVFITAALVSIYQRKLHHIQYFTLIPTLDRKMQLLEISIPCSGEGVDAALDDLKAFLSAISLDAEKADKYCGAVKEVLNNIVMYSGRGEKQLIDIRANYENQEVVVSIKDNGKPFDPTKLENHKKGLSSVSAITSKFEYKYMFKQNMTFLTFHVL